MGLFHAHARLGPCRALLPRALEIRDLVVLSLLFIEKQQRTQGGGANDNAMVGMNSAVRFAVAC